LYSKEEVRELLRAAQRLPSTHGLRSQTYYCLLGLLTVTGLRISEARNLQTEDVDLKEGVLTIRGAKFGKSRLVPIHASTCKVLSAYASRRDRFLAHEANDIFVSGRGTRLDGAEIRRTFYVLCGRSGCVALRIVMGHVFTHFRHRFAVEALVQWYRSGQDVEPPADLDDVSGACSRGRHLLVLIRLPRADGAGRQAIRSYWEKQS
jgi:site-specific recombinase XerD